jgi:hypothetical protein
MAEETKSAKSVTSVVGDVTKAINDAWEFFLPATIRAFVAVAIIALLGGMAPLRAALHSLASALASVDVRGLAELLDKYKLTPLVPVVTLFVLATLAYSFNRIVFVVAGLIPIGLSHSQTTLLLAKCSGASVWYRMSYIATPGELAQAIDLELAKARVVGEQVLLENLDYWTKRQIDHLQQFGFAKFLALWSVAWTLILVHTAGVPPGMFTRLLLLLLLNLGWASIALLRALYAIEQTAHAKISAMVLLFTVLNRPCTSIGDEKKTFIDRQVDVLGNQGWWWITVGSVDWARMVKDFDTSNSIISGIRSRWSKKG